MFTEDILSASVLTSVTVKKHLSLKEKGLFCFGPQFQRFHSMITWPLWVCGEAEHPGREGMAEQICSPNGHWEIDREERSRGKI
jgi:hypothetical protein